MQALRLFTGMVMLAALFAAGCAGTQDVKYQPTSIYSSMDSTALVYTNPMAAAPVNDHPLRWIAFLVTPAGVVLDYGVNRPLYSLASVFPGLFGYTSEDAMLHSQRWTLSGYQYLGSQ
jgi:hypothetical protein